MAPTKAGQYFTAEERKSMLKLSENNIIKLINMKSTRRKNKGYARLFIVGT